MLAALLIYPSVVLLAVIIVGGFVRWQSVPTDRRRTELVMVVAIFVSVASAAAQAIANSLSRVRPLKYDLYVYRFDALFGQPSFFLGQVAMRHFWLEALLQISYGILPTAVSVVIATYIYLRSDELRYVVLALALNLLAAPIFYLLFPVCGPQFAFPHFPAPPGIVMSHAIPIAAAPNGVPSVHFSTALLLAWVCHYWRTGLVISIAYLALIGFATLASGQHYLFDLFAAVPYSAAVLALASAFDRTKLASSGREPTMVNAGIRQSN